MSHSLRVAALRGPVLSTSALLLDYLRLELAAERLEQLRVLYLDVNNALLCDVVLSRGSVSEVRVSPREIVREAIEVGATAIILVHNHPSGDPTPSPEDVRITQRVAAAAAIFDVTLHDHLIVAQDGWSSLAALGLLRPAGSSL
jgi:DNA repair protein RadC